MAVRQPRLSEQRAWPQARALLRRTALSVLSTRRDQELVRAGDAHEALDSEVRWRPPAPVVLWSKTTCAAQGTHSIR
uniref:Predicted protein n=1 Tax=Hordeum vulgare subsp. vulgare TaxID=112509 RepID=F2EJH3_HORVV|nr:predicted protein [Hordeum vulgare subsp. vulgare]